MTRLHVLTLLLLAFAATPAAAATNTFNGTTDSDWNTSTNWSAGHVPTSAEDVLINVAGKSPSLSADGVANSVSIASAHILTVTGHTLAVGPGSSSLVGQLVIGTNGLVTLAGAMSVTHGGGPADPAMSFAGGTGGGVDVLSGGALNFAVDADRVLNNGTDLHLHVFAGGTLEQTIGGPEGGVVDIPVDNDGQVLATAGRLLLRGGSGVGQTSGGIYNATSPATIAFQGTTDLSTSGRLTGTGTMEFNGGTLTIPSGSVALPSAYDPGATSFTLGDLSLGSDGGTGSLTSIGGNRLGAGTLTVTGTTAISQFGNNFNGGTTNLNGTTTIGAGVGISGATVNLGGAAGLNAGGGINVATGSLSIANGGTLTVADNVNIFSLGGGTLHVAAGGTLTRSASGVDGQLGIPVTNQGTVHAAGGTMRFNNGLTQTSGTTLVDATLAVQGGFSVALQGGTLSGNGTVTGVVNNSGGTVAPGASPGLLTITGDYTQGAGGTLAEEITGAALAAFDRLAVSGTATLDGTLAIKSSSFSPAPSDTFKIISGATTRIGSFATLTGADVNDAHYHEQDDADGVTLLTNVDPPPPTTETTPPPTQTTPVTPPPAQPVVPKQVPITQIVSLPSPHVCASRRHFRIHLRNHGLHPLQATVFVNGKRVKVVTGEHLAADIDLRGLPKGTIRVRITIRYREGKALTGVRTYHTCTARRHPAQAPPRLMARRGCPSYPAAADGPSSRSSSRRGTSPHSCSRR